jgi:16S rRNA (uracil1498-N3)-methyltransferase
MMHRFFVTPDAIRDGTIHFTGSQARQIRQVLRLRPGTEVIVLDNSGQEYIVTLTTVRQTEATAQIEAQRPSTSEPHAQLTLYQSLLPRDKFEWVLQKGTEVGVSAFVPLITQRSLVQEASAATNKRTRWERIISEAAEQSGRGRLPTLHSPLSFGTALTQVERAHCALIPWEKAEGQGVGVPLSKLPAEIARPEIALFIGPEGGFSEEEIERATAAGVHPVTLGRRILRTETAAVVATALVLYELGEMGERVKR